MNNKVNIIAEIGINHQGNLDLMKDMMIAAKGCGVDYVKSQKREPKVCLTKEQYKRPYDSPHSFGKTYGEHKENLELSLVQWKKLFRFANEIGIKIFMSVFDTVSANNMNNLGMDLFKIGSAEVTKLELLEEVKDFNKPIILSTGMSTIEETDEAVKILQGTDFALLHCNSTYPAPLKDLNLKCIQTLKERYGCEVGYSGHEFRLGTSVACVYLGASIIERHITLDRTMWGSDHLSSVEPQGLIKLVKGIRELETAYGDGIKKVTKDEEKIRKKLRG